MEDEFRRLLVAFQDRVYNQAFRMLGNREDAEDATQDVFLRVHRSLEKFRGESKLSSWIFRITANVCISRLRRRQKNLQSIESPDELNGLSLESVTADDAPGPDELLESKETAAFVRSEVRSLPPKWAMAVSLFHFEGLSYDEIAEAMGVPRATAATYILRGRRRLARILVDVLS